MLSFRFHIILIITLFLTGVAGMGQSSHNEGIFNMSHLTGQFGLSASYRTQNSQLGEILEKQFTDHLAAGLRINAGSYIWNPDIIKFTVEGEYNHEFLDENYLIIPDRSEVRSLYRLNLRSDLLQGKDLSLSAYTNMGISYFNRENLTNVRSDNSTSGILLSISNSFMPSSIRFTRTKWTQAETETGREFSMDQKILDARSNRSFGKNDRTEIRYSYRDYSYNYTDLPANNNRMHSAGLNNQFWLDDKHKYSASTSINYYTQDGSYSFSRIEAGERIVLHMPYNFDAFGDIRHHTLRLTDRSISTNRAGISVTHRLYESLKSSLWGDYSLTDQGNYREQSLKGGFGFEYTKKTIFGRVNLSYQHFTNFFSAAGKNRSSQVELEEHTLSDSEITTLNRPFVEQSSVMLTDLSSTIIYQEGIDYLLGNINDFTTITRIPGGQIADNQAILATYTSVLPGSYDLTASNNNLAAGLLLFDRLIELYYRGAAQTYPLDEAVQYITVDRYFQNVTGIRINYKQLTAGAEYDRYNSSLIPYERFRYYLIYNIRIKDNIVIGINANLRDYRILGTGIEHTYANASGRFTYTPSRTLTFNSEIGYLHQEGQNINLDLLTARAEVIKMIRKLSLKGGINFYSREYSNSSFLFSRSYIEIVRKF